MNNLNLRYQLEDKPSFWRNILFGLQWLAIAMPMIIIVGKIVATLQFEDPSQQIIYIQKVFFVIGLSILIQVIWGHKLPLVIGPASVLLVGITASQGAGINTIYSSILIGGLILTLISISGLFEHLKKLFTPRVVVTILMLISFTLIPMIINLLFANSAVISPLTNLLFALAFVFSLFLANKFLTGIWKSTLIIWGMVLGSIIYALLFPEGIASVSASTGFISGFFTDFNTRIFPLEIGTLISFLICFIALAINDLGSIQAIGGMLNVDNMPKRISKGITLTGVLNIISGFFAVIGPVNYSMSPGVIASTSVASRYPLIPAGIALVILAFFPPALNLIAVIPSVVIGSTFIYTLCSQLAAGLMLAFNSMKDFRLEYGLIIGLPLMLSILISFLPEAVVISFPTWLRPILGNGFVVGVLAVLVMEHIIYKKLKS
ncbi:MAG: purine/pyrimidine permease [Peptococcaceae bacterium]|nr:purine/pyrimidine permease [Peptococcaceae bacterium]